MTDSPESSAEMWDAVIAAPKHHRLALENDQVRVLETRVEPGETVPMHTHQWPAVNYVISWSDFVRRDESGEITLDTRTRDIAVGAGTAIWSPSLALHTLENVGTDPIHIITVEVKGSGN